MLSFIKIPKVIAYIILVMTAVFSVVSCGKSSDSFKVTDSKGNIVTIGNPQQMSNDKTGKWRYSHISNEGKDTNPLELVGPYIENFMIGKDEFHIIINNYLLVYSIKPVDTNFYQLQIKTYPDCPAADVNCALTGVTLALYDINLSDGTPKFAKLDIRKADVSLQDLSDEEVERREKMAGL